MEIEDIWLKYQTGIKAFVRSKVSDPDEVDDLIQTILIKTHQNLHTVKSETKVKSWLFRVTNNAIIDFYRKKDQTGQLETESLWHGEDGNEAQKILAQCILPFVNALPKETVKLLIDIDIEGRPQKEYAKTLGIHYSTLKSRVQKGRGQLRDLFIQCCDLSLDQYGNIIDFEPKSPGCEKC